MKWTAHVNDTVFYHIPIWQKHFRYRFLARIWAEWYLLFRNTCGQIVITKYGEQVEVAPMSGETA